LLATIGGCVESPPAPISGNLLADVEPSTTDGVTHAERLADGLASEEGDHWLTGVVARVGARAFVSWDLGSERPIRCALLQGDNNDVYHLSGSLDGKTWQRLWTAEPAREPGVRLRSGRLDGRARHVRLEATGGDGLYSVAEVALFADCPQTFPDVGLARSPGVPLEEAARTEIWLFAAALTLFVLVHRKGGPRVTWALGLVPLGASYLLARDLAEIYPFFDVEPALRAAIAIVAGAVLIKEAFFPLRLAPDPRVTRAVLAFLALSAVGSYYHFGALQFNDAAHGRRTFVHTFDMRHYFPVAKYFPELRFDGLYLASLAAYLELRPDTTDEELTRVRLRDLTNYEMLTGTRAKAQLPEIRARFSPARWETFKRDMGYFLDTMGPGDYLGSMQDHGGNATPVWLIAAWLVFRSAPASELSLSLGGFIDPVLLLILFIAVARAFGLRTMLFVAIIFGATDFYNFGSNLMGSTLRQDWLVGLGLGACAIKTGRPFLGGFLLAFAGLIRAFPAVAAAFLAVPLLWALVAFVREHRRLPAPRAFAAEHRPTVRAIAGATAGVTMLMLVSTGLFGWRAAWSTWFDKIAIHAHSPSTNNVGLRNVMMFDPDLSAKQLIRNDHPEPWDEWQAQQVKTIAKRRVAFYLATALGCALALLACRGRRLEQVAMLGLLCIPFLFYPSNYYCHFMFLLPLAGKAGNDPRDREFAWIGVVLAAMCLGQYFTLAEGWTDLRYTYQSFVLLGACVLLLAPLARAGWRSLKTELKAGPKIQQEGQVG
jgi:hypothetical protein